MVEQIDAFFCLIKFGFDKCAYYKSARAIEIMMMYILDNFDFSDWYFGCRLFYSNAYSFFNNAAVSIIGAFSTIRVFNYSLLQHLYEACDTKFNLRYVLRTH